MLSRFTSACALELMSAARRMTLISASLLTIRRRSTSPAALLIARDFSPLSTAATSSKSESEVAEGTR